MAWLCGRCADIWLAAAVDRKENQMKFRNPETGEVFDSLREASDKFCSDHDCFWRECPLDKANESRACWDWIQEYPIEAARLMGYEVVEDEQFREVTKMMKEANMDKPRICEVLGVEVGERFSISPVEKQLYVSESGNIIDDDRHLFAQLFVDAINHPDRIIRKPRFTQQEVESAKIISVLFPEATHIGRLRGSNALIIIGADNGWIANIENSLFQEIKSGQSVTLDEIIGGAE